MKNLSCLVMIPKINIILIKLLFLLILHQKKEINYLFGNLLTYDICKEIKTSTPIIRKIYFFSEKYNTNNYDCILFDEEPQDFEDKDITREDTKNGIAISIRGNEKKYLLLLEDNEDLK